jgi:hypothetical protein
MPAPGWVFVPVHVRVANLDQYPEFLLLFVDGRGWHTLTQVPDSGVSASEGLSGGTYCALRRAEFATADIGPGEDAEGDYFENHPHLIRSGTEVPTNYSVRIGDPTVRLDHVFRIANLTDEALSLEHVKDVVTLRDGRKVERPITGIGRRLPPIAYGHEFPRRIRIENMDDYPDYTFLMRFRWGYTIMKPGRNVTFGRVYAVKKADFDPSEIPVSYTEAWNYYVDHPKLMTVPLCLSVSQFADMIDVFIIDSISNGRVHFHPVAMEFTHSNGQAGRIPAARLPYERVPELLDGIPDSKLSKRCTDWTLYAHLENLDSFPDLVFLRGWPRSRQVLASRDTFELEPDTVCIVRKSEFAAGRLGTQAQRAAFLQAVEAEPMDFDMSQCPFGLSQEARKICGFRLERDSSGRVRSKLVRVISVKTDGSRESFDIPDGGRVSSHVVRHGHEARGPHGPRRHRTAEVRAEELPGWFGWLWFVGVPLLALAGIALVLLRRKSRPSGT